MEEKDARALPTVEEARKALAIGVERLARGTAFAFSVLILFITAVEILRVARMATGFGEVFLFPLFAVGVWYAAPHVMARAYGSLIRNGRLVRATVTSGPRAMMEKSVDFLGPIVALLGLAMPTQLVNYRVDGAGAQLGALFADESLIQDPDGCWALTTDGPGRKAWLFRRQSR